MPSHSFFQVFPSHSWREWTSLLLSFPRCSLIRWLVLPFLQGLIQCWGSNFITVFPLLLLRPHGWLHIQLWRARWLGAVARERFLSPRRGFMSESHCLCYEILNKWAKLKKITFILACTGFYFNQMPSGPHMLMIIFCFAKFFWIWSFLILYKIPGTARFLNFYWEQTEIFLLHRHLGRTSENPLRSLTTHLFPHISSSSHKMKKCNLNSLHYKEVML